MTFTSEKSTKAPLLVRFSKRTFLGRKPNATTDVVAEVGTIVDLTECENVGILADAEEVARRVCFGGRPVRAALVDEGDRDRLFPKARRR